MWNNRLRFALNEIVIEPCLQVGWAPPLTYASPCSQLDSLVYFRVMCNEKRLQKVAAARLSPKRRILFQPVIIARCISSSRDICAIPNSEKYHQCVTARFCVEFKDIRLRHAITRLFYTLRTRSVSTSRWFTIQTFQHTSGMFDDL